MPDLEERTIESLPDTCENCGATLTDAEKQRILDEGASVADRVAITLQAIAAAVLPHPRPCGPVDGAAPGRPTATSL